MPRKFLIVAAISGFICVALGAFGAHTLKRLIIPEQLAAFETGVRYQFYHTIVLIVVSVLISTKGDNIFLKRAGYFFITGIIFFSGSLYFLSTQNILHANMNWLGPFTPIGGLFFIIGWLMIVIYAVKNKY
ncbi:MAG: DUF423 domain-containing protein [Bacteroidia bacterium]